MGRVYDALKRAAEQNGAQPKRDEAAVQREEKALAPVEPNGHRRDAEETARVAGITRDSSEPRAPRSAADSRASREPSDSRGNGARVAEESRAGGVGATATDEAAEFLFRRSRHFQSPESATTSAPTEHTVTTGGSALPAGSASRAAGATLGAAGSARTPEFVTLDISAARVEPHLVAITQPRSAHAERYRSLRTRVLHAGERKKMQAFVVTSAGVMEGKTLTAINLSWLLAQTDGVSALLIDGDLRNPCAGDYLGLEAPTGLSEVLAGQATLQESIVRLEPAGLHLLPGGAARDDVAELLSGPTFSAVLREARRMFEIGRAHV